MWFFKGDALYDCFLEIRELFHVSPVCEADIDTAIRMRAWDFEDALQYCSAKSIEADVIVTRNVKDFSFSEIPVMTPEEFIRKASII